jgi:hypothetical protein
MCPSEEHSHDDLHFVGGDNSPPDPRPKSDLDEEADRLEQLVHSPNRDSTKPAAQFSLRALFAYTTLLAIGLASVTWFPENYAAGVLGAVTLTVCLFALRATDLPYMRVVCTALLVLYLGAIAGTLFRSLAIGA